MSDLTAEERDYWGATDEDEQTQPLPETRLIGEKLFAKIDGKVMRFPLRLRRADITEFVTQAGEDDLPLFEMIVGKYAAEEDRQAFAALDLIDQTVIAVAYFAAFRDFAEASLGKSQR